MNSLFYSFSSLVSVVKATVRKAQLGRRIALTALAIALLIGSVGYMPSAQAADASKTGAGGTSAVRPSHNPISNENFTGGVDLTALDRQGKNVQPPAESKVGLVDRLKNLLPGRSSKKSPANAPRSNVQPEKNPTLDRYPN
ncbi:MULTISPECIES: hypothetical protein [Cyanophyceae]|uniref:hypothetical protein n=1 Tax=Cyanophyceae TaxID=3028117 RepID=UPI0016826717|nr:MULTISPECIES: hypothetical protein [Cyanophyceae]MBD1915711.1 hypothetical protein [Phormidium sp. FACHB-77]MBD2029040.1 hypothetical protein [Phormidium sp. FACHB-322]MBD2052203.1 hypothetical protein [Leptolyngbya sp. FACHB-60]